MSRVRMIGVAALIAAGMTLPALASTGAVVRLPFVMHTYQEMLYTGFDAPVASVQLTAPNGDVRCSFVKAVYVDGSSSQVFSGNLAMNAPKTITFDNKNVQRLDFDCMATSGRGFIEMSLSNT